MFLRFYISRDDLPLPVLTVKNTLFPALMAFITAIVQVLDSFAKNSKS